MKKFFILITIIILPVFLTACTKSTTETNSQSESTQQNNETDNKSIENFKGTIADLLNLNVPLKCTSKYDDENGTFNMVSYVSGKNSYSEFDFDMNGEKYTSYSIIKDDWVYSWGSMMEGGTKMKISEMEKMAEETSEEDTNGEYGASAQYNENLDYKCEPWIVDSSKFNPPSDVEFTDMTEMIKNVKESVENMDLDSMKGPACDACEMLGDSAKIAECKSNLGCE